AHESRILPRVFRHLRAARQSADPEWRQGWRDCSPGEGDRVGSAQSLGAPTAATGQGRRL
ncbi:uncharacterized protein METZ01_LOCUS502137, partial [marine metagenome]